MPLLAQTLKEHALSKLSPDGCKPAAASPASCLQGNYLCLVQGVCADTASCDLTAVVLAASIEEVQRTLEVALARQESSVGRQDEIVVMAGRGQGDSFQEE